MTARNRLAALGNSRFLTVAAALLLVAATVPFAVFAVPQTVGADTSYIVVSSSMSPAISANDAILVESVPPASVAEGDVIVFEAFGDSATDEDVSVVTHRVVDVMRTEQGIAFRTKGDALEEVDPRPVPASALVGRVTFTIPYLGYVVQFAGSDRGFIALVVVPFGLLIVTELWNLFGMLVDGDSATSEEEVAEPSPEE